eukprot:3172498-Amphidinium_carterae.1
MGFVFDGPWAMAEIARSVTVAETVRKAIGSDSSPQQVALLAGTDISIGGQYTIHLGCETFGHTRPYHLCLACYLLVLSCWFPTYVSI